MDCLRGALKGCHDCSSALSQRFDSQAARLRILTKEFSRRRVAARIIEGEQVESSRPPFSTHCPPLHRSTTSPLHHSTTPPLHHFTTPPLHHFTTPPLHRSTAPGLHRSITPSLPAAFQSCEALRFVFQESRVIPDYEIHALPILRMRFGNRDICDRRMRNTHPEVANPGGQASGRHA